MTRIDRDIIDTFRTQGVVKLSGVFEEWVELLRATGRFSTGASERRSIAGVAAAV